VLARLFGLGPWSAFRASRPTLDREAARAIVLAHIRRARRRAGVEIEVEGIERLPAAGSFVLVYNQTSIADDLGNLELIWPRLDRSALASEYGLLPFFRSAAAKVGIELVRRGDRSATDALLERLARAAAAGEAVSMAAEGRLSPDGEVGRFKRGAFLVAIRAGVPVIPMAIAGGREILRPGSLRMRPGTLRYRLGNPIPSAGFSDETAPELAETARTAVAAVYFELRSAAREART